MATQARGAAGAARPPSQADIRGAARRAAPDRARTAHRRDGASGASIAEQEKLLEDLHLSRWIDTFCFGWGRPPDPKGKRQDSEPSDHSVDPTTDQPDGSPSPAWGTAADHHHDEPAPQPEGGPPP